MFPVNVEFEMCDDFLMISRPPAPERKEICSTSTALK
jgi:hypothetical protein